MSDEKVSKLTYGVGFNDRSRPAWVNGKDKKEYKLWQGMLERCYSPKYLEKMPTYVGCTVSENFKSYSYFYDWCQSQVGFGKEGFQIDKDVLFKGNKMYSENTCVFLPSNLNSLFTKRNRGRGMYPLGVSEDKRGRRGAKKYSANCSDGSSRLKFLGYHQTPTEAFLAYKKYKENLIKELAEQYKDEIDPRAYEALMNYTVDIDD